MLFSLLLSCVLSFFYKYVTFSVQFSSSVVPDSLQPHGLQHAKLPCPLPTPRACSNSWPLSWWCHSAVWSFVVPFSSCLQSFPASEFISYMICLLHKSCLQWKHYYVSTGSVLTCPALQRQCVTVQCKIDVEGKETPLVTYLLISIVNQIFNSVQLLSHVRLCHSTDGSKPGFPVTNSRNYSNSCPSVGDAIQPSHPLLALSPPTFNLSQYQGLFQWVALHIRWPKNWSFSFNISPSNEYSGLISFQKDWLDLLAVQGSLKSLFQHHSSKASILRCSAFFILQLSHSYMTTGKTIALTGWTFVGKVMSLLFNMLSRLVITFLPRSKRPLISWLQSPSAVILKPPKIKSDTASTVSPSTCHEVMGPDAMILVFWMWIFTNFSTLLFHFH